MFRTKRDLLSERASGRVPRAGWVRGRPHRCYVISRPIRRISGPVRVWPTGIPNLSVLALNFHSNVEREGCVRT